MNSSNHNRDEAGRSGAEPRASIDAMISEAMDLELAGDHARAAAVWKLIDAKYAGQREVVNGLRSGLEHLREHRPATKDFTSAVMVRLAGDDDLDALVTASRTHLDESASDIADDDAAQTSTTVGTRHKSASGISRSRDSMWRRLTRLRVSTTTIAFVLGMCATTVLVVIASKYPRPEPRSIAGEQAIQRAMQLPETPEIADSTPMMKLHPGLRMSGSDRYERSYASGSSLTIAGGSGAIHARVPIGIAPFASPVTLASGDGVLTQGARVVFDPLWRMREQGLGEGVLQPTDRTVLPIGRVRGDRIELDAAGMLVMPVTR